MPGMGGMGMLSGVGSSSLLGGDAGDVRYPYYLIIGRVPAAATGFAAKPRQRIRIRLINAASDTAFRVALAGHAMTVTHTDGFPVVPTEVDALLMGMGERYDVIVTARDGGIPLVAWAEGKSAVARALLTTATGTPPDAGYQPPELDRRVGTVEMFTASPEVDLRLGEPDVNLQANLSGGMMQYNWAINGGPYGSNQPIGIEQDQTATLTFFNTTMMWHPMHLHGHTFYTTGTEGGRIPESAWWPGNTVLVGVAQARDVEFVANNPGDWMVHCHLPHHMMNQMSSNVGPMSRNGTGMPAGVDMNNGMGMLNGTPGAPLGDDYGPSLGRGLGVGSTNDQPVANTPLSEPKAMAAMGGMQHDMSKMGGMQGMHHGGMSMESDVAKNANSVPGFPQDAYMEGPMMAMDEMVKRPENFGLRPGWSGFMQGMMTFVRVLPPDEYDKVMEQIRQGQPMKMNMPGMQHGM
jgi:hypothetical protein